MNKKFTKTILAFAFFANATTIANAATTWIGLANPITAADWNTASNWSPSGVPTPSEKITFTTVVSINSNVPITNTNPIDITGSASVTIIDNGGITFNAGNVRIQGPGTLTNNATVSFINVTYDINPVTAGATIINNGTMNVKNLNIGSGTFAGTFINNSTLLVSADIVIEEGNFNNALGATTISTGIEIRNGGNINNYGTYSSLGTGSIAKILISSGGTMHNYSTGVINSQITTGNIPAIDISGTFINDGVTKVGNFPPGSGSVNPGSQGIIVRNGGNLASSGNMVFNIDPANCVINNNSGTTGSFSVTGTNTIYSGLNCTGIILPITLISFTAQKTNECTANLQWTVADAINFNGYEIEVSKDAVKFTIINTISSVAGKYNYALNAPLPNSSNAYYRLKMVDNDGRFKYSNIVSIAGCKTNTSISIFPNPAQKSIQVLGIEAGKTVQIFDALGRRVIAKENVNNQETIQIDFLQKGIYSVQILNKKVGTTNTVLKLIKN